MVGINGMRMVWRGGDGGQGWDWDGEAGEIRVDKWEGVFIKRGIPMVMGYCTE